MAKSYPPQKTVGEPSITAEPQATGSPILETGTPPTKTLDEPLAKVESWHSEPQQCVTQW